MSLQIETRKMLIIGKCLHFTCSSVLRSKYSSHKFNLCTTNLCACKRLLHLSLINTEPQQNRQCLVPQRDVFSRRSKSTLPHNQMGFVEQKRHMGRAAKFVNSSPSKIQPYMKLMRIDKPIGN